MLKSYFPKACELSQDEISKKLIEFRSQDCQKCFRGKFEINFLVIFLKKLIEEVNNKKSSYFTNKVKVSLQVSMKTIISDLSQYAYTPDCLYTYLESFQEQNEMSSYTEKYPQLKNYSA